MSEHWNQRGEWLENISHVRTSCFYWKIEAARLLTRPIVAHLVVRPSWLRGNLSPGGTCNIAIWAEFFLYGHMKLFYQSIQVKNPQIVTIYVFSTFIWSWTAFYVEAGIINALAHISVPKLCCRAGGSKMKRYRKGNIDEDEQKAPSYLVSETDSEPRSKNTLVHVYYCQPGRHLLQEGN